MESITPIHHIEAAACQLAVVHADAQAACPYAAGTEAARLFHLHFMRARLHLLEAFVADLLHPEEMGYAVQPWVRERARAVLCRPKEGVTQ